MKTMLMGMAVAAASMGAPGVGWAEGGKSEVVELTAPILPNVLVMYAGQGANYPSDPEAQRALAVDSALVYEELLLECAEDYPSITLLGPGIEALTPTQLALNYGAVAECGYVKYTAKPYWIPQLVDDVDICGEVLGPDWTLPTQADVEGFSEAELAFMAQTLTDASGVGGWGSSFYFGLQVFVRASDGSIQVGDLTPGASPRVAPIVPLMQGWDPTMHYEGGVSLRCIRKTIVIEVL